MYKLVNKATPALFRRANDPYKILKQSFASRNPTPTSPSLVDGLAHGLGFGLVLIILGSLRELIGSGEIFNNMASLINVQKISLVGYDGFLLVLLPPGGFILLGLLIAAKNIITERRQRATKAQKPSVYTKRVRVS